MFINLSPTFFTNLQQHKDTHYSINMGGQNHTRWWTIIQNIRTQFNPPPKNQIVSKLLFISQIFFYCFFRFIWNIKNKYVFL